MLLFCLLATAACAPPTDPAVPPVVTVEWLAAHRRDPGLLLLHVGPRADYDSSHIAGAQYLDYHQIHAPMARGGLSLELPSPAELDSVLRAHGVSAGSKVVLYAGGGWLTPTSRVLLTLEWAGLDGRAGILEGGLVAWRAAGGEVSTEVPHVAAGTFVTRPHPELLVDAKFVAAHLHDPAVAIIDARDPGFYLDTLDNEMPRGGHIPGATNVPYTSLSDDRGVLKSRPELERIFAAAGAAKGKTVVVYCHIGQQGSWVQYVARSLGYDARLYDGSFEEWSARAELPVDGARRHAKGGR
jgi:thiosulfate/3-mercaptopyruvate sulfurtransferase